MSDTDTTLAAYVLRLRINSQNLSLESKNDLLRKPLQKLTLACISKLGSALLPPKRTSRREKMQSKTATKFGMTMGKKLKVHKKEQNIGLLKADGNDVRGIICIIRHQCKNEITESSIEIASECSAIISKINLSCSTSVYSGWIAQLLECIVSAFGSEFDASENTLTLADIVMDTIHALLKKAKMTLTSQLVTMFVELGSVWSSQDRAGLVISLLRTMSPVDLSKSYIDKDLSSRNYCVCIEEILHRLLDLIHIYVSAREPQLLTSVSSTLLAAILYFGHHGLLDYFNSLCW